MSTKKLQILGSMIPQNVDADTLDGKHAEEFASASEIEQLKQQIGDESVSEQIGAAVGNIDYPVDSVNGKTGAVVLTASDVGALPADTSIPSISGLATEDYVDEKIEDVTTELNTKVDKIDGKGLSTNDYTTTEKDKLAGIATGANKTVVDSALSSSSTNPVQNKVVNVAISNLNTLVGDESVSDQISAAIANKSDVGHTHTAAQVGADPSGSAANALTNAKSYTDTKIADLINSAPTTLDTLGEIATAMEDNADVVAALEESIGTKANANDLTSHTSNKSNPHGVTLSQLGVTATAAELNYVGGVTSKVQTQLNAKVPTSRTVNGKALSANITLSASDVGADASGSANTALTSAKAYTDAEITEWVGDKTVSEQISTAIASKSDSTHTHDDRYYTESEINTKLSGKSDTSHTHSAYVNQNAFSNVVVGSTTIAADSTTDTLTLAAGSNITLTPDASGDKVTIAAKDTVYTHPNSGATAGTYKSVTVNSQGHVTGGSNPTTLSGYGITDAATKTELNAVSTLVGDTSVSEQIDEAFDGAITGLSVSGKTITYTKGDGSTGTITTQDTNITYSVATASKDGLMSKTDKSKLDNVDTYATSIPFIAGTQTAVTGTWTGTTSEISSLVDGQTIRYWLPYKGSGNATLNLTLSDGTTTGAINCYYNGTSRLTTHYAAGNIILLTYRENVSVAGSSTKYTGWWAQSDYGDGNYYDRIRYQQNVRCGTTAIVAGNIIVGTGGVYQHLKSGAAFDVTYPILYADGAIAASGTSTSTYLVRSFTATTTQSITLTAYKPVFIRGSLSGTTFTPVSTTPLTQTVPTTEDGYDYMLLGTAYSSTGMYLLPEHPIFRYKNGVFGKDVTYSNATTSKAGLMSAADKTTLNNLDSLVGDVAVSTQISNAVAEKASQKSAQVTLSASGWSASDDVFTQTVTASPLTGDGNLIVSPEPSNMIAYVSSSIYASDYTGSNITFIATTQPTENLLVNVMAII